MANGVKVGDKAPDFTLPSQTGDQVRLHDRLGERVAVLYFFPKDGTPGCTAQACAFRDSHEVFTDAGAEVIGVSSDSVDSHATFSGRHELPFTLVSGSRPDESQDRQIAQTNPAANARAAASFPVASGNQAFRLG